MDAWAIARRKARSFLALPIAEQGGFFVLYGASGLVRAMLCFIPFRYIEPLLGTRHDNRHLSVVADSHTCARARRIGKLVALSCRYTPWRSQCLVQAILARCVFVAFKVPSVTHLGVSRAGGDFSAHAWTHVGPAVVTGRRQHHAFTIVATYVATL
jgi:hypothetical protein